jgi:hypothetical protein
MSPGHYGDPEDEAKVVGKQCHESHGKQRTGKSAHGIERLPKAVGRTTQRWRRETADQSVAWRTANTPAALMEMMNQRHWLWRRGKSQILCLFTSKGADPCAADSRTRY